MDTLSFLSMQGFAGDSVPLGEGLLSVNIGSPEISLKEMFSLRKNPLPLDASETVLRWVGVLRPVLPRIVRLDFTLENLHNYHHRHTDASQSILLRGLVLGNPWLRELILHDLEMDLEGDALKVLLECLAHPECQLERLEFTLPLRGQDMARIAEAMMASENLRKTLRCLKVEGCGFTHRRLSRASEMSLVYPPDEGFNGASLRAFAGFLREAGPGYALEEVAFSCYSHEQVITGEDLQIFAEALSHVPSLRKVSLCNMRLCRESILHFARPLRAGYLPILDDLDLSSNMEMGVQGFLEVIQALCERRSPLVQLRMRGIMSRYGGEERDGEVDASCLYDLLASPESCLRVLDVSQNRFPPEVAEAIVRGVGTRGAQRLEKLNLSYVGLSDAHLEVLGESLQANTSITSLTLGSAQNGEGAVNRLLAGICAGDTLQTLDLTVCNVDGIGTVNLAKNMEIAEAFLADRYPMDELRIAISSDVQERLRRKTRARLESRARVAQAMRNAIRPNTFPLGVYEAVLTTLG